MPYRDMGLKDAARFLGMDARQAQRMAERGTIPSRRVSGEYVFNRAGLTEWLQQRMVDSPHDHMHQTDSGMSEHRQTDPSSLLISPMLMVEGVEVDCHARTRSSVPRELVRLAERTGLVYDSEAVLSALQQREALCSTAMEEGIAIPHPRRPLEYEIAESLICVARMPGGIPYGAPDGGLTDLFFLTCSQDDSHHLHVLARLCRMLHHEGFLASLREAASPGELVDLLRDRERAVVADSKK